MLDETFDARKANKGDETVLISQYLSISDEWLMIQGGRVVCGDVSMTLTQAVGHDQVRNVEAMQIRIAVTEGSRRESPPSLSAPKLIPN